MKEPRTEPINLKIGDRFKTPLTIVEVVDYRGEYKTFHDEREWKIKDEETGEEKWVDFEWFLTMMRARLYN